MLVQEVSTTIDLFLVQLAHESEMSHRLRPSSGHQLRVSLQVVQSLPSTEGGAHRGANQEERPLLAEKLARSFAFNLVVEVPGLPVVRVHHREVEGHSGHELMVR